MLFLVGTGPGKINKVMRILKFLLKSISIIVALAGAGFLLGREIFLFLGVNQLESSLSTLRRAELDAKHFEICQRKGVEPIRGEPYSILQLRFISDQSYVLEVVCNQYNFDPVVIGEESLPTFVKRVPGDSGVIWGETLSGVRLEVFGRQAAVGVDNKKIVSLSSDQDLGISPETSCAGLGFTCCQLESEVGRGRQVTQVTDCSQSCYESCANRPVVLSLMTEPALNRLNEPLEIYSGETVTFYYVLADNQMENLVVTLDFGDGQRQEFSQREGTVEHIYQCSNPVCNYQFKLTAENGAGIKNADLPINSQQIVVK